VAGGFAGAVRGKWSGAVGKLSSLAEVQLPISCAAEQSRDLRGVNRRGGSATGNLGAEGGGERSGWARVCEAGAGDVLLVEAVVAVAGLREHFPERRGDGGEAGRQVVRIVSQALRLGGRGTKL